MNAATLMPGTAQQAALQLSEEWSLPVFPCRAHDEVLSGKAYKAKSPLTSNGFADASRNLDQIEHWWARWPDALVGVPTGKASKLLVIDIDPEGKEWYRERAQALACARVHKTLRGFHLLYRMPEHEIRNSAGKLALGVDVRGEGGYIIWWPAHDLNAVGELEDLSEPPRWLVDALIDSKRREPDPSDKPVVASGATFAEGQRNQSLTREAGKLRRVSGLSAESLFAALAQINRERCNPPLAEPEVRTIAESVARYAPGEDKPDIAVVPVRSPLDWESLEGRTPPEREWAVPHWLPQGHPSLIAGRGGIGKTLLVQHIGTSQVLQYAYIDEIVRQQRILVWAGEDDHDELWRRQLPICSYFEVPPSDLTGRLILQSYEGVDITLAAPIFGNLAPTPMLAELTAQVRDYQADYVYLDNIARIFGGNESDRHSVTQFLAWISAACRPAGVCLLGHPAKGIGSEYSGSTAWEGAVRARLYLSDRLPDAEPTDEDDEPDSTVRYLSRRKSNYSPNDWRRLNYQNGVLVPEDTSSGPAPMGTVGGDYAKDIVRRAVRKLKEMGMHGNTSTRSPDYLPKLAKQYGLLDRLAEKRFGAFMRDMLKDGELLVQTIGQYSNRSPKPGLVLR